MGDDWRGWKDGKYDNRYHGNNRRNKNKNTSKVILGASIGILAIIAIVVYQNYDVTIYDKKVDEIIPTESLEKSINEISENMPIKIEPKKSDSESIQVSTKKYPTVTLKMDNRPSNGPTADFTITKVESKDMEFYKIVTIFMSMELNMKFQDSVYFSPTSGWTLKNPAGDIYAEACHGTKSDIVVIRGKDDPNRTWSICYHVEKELKQFDLRKDTNKIGTIILD